MRIAKLGKRVFDEDCCHAAGCRSRVHDRMRRLETWFHPLALGQPLPTLPLWLAADIAVALDLETSYEEACRSLRIE